MTRITDEQARAYVALVARISADPEAGDYILPFRAGYICDADPTPRDITIEDSDDSPIAGIEGEGEEALEIARMLAAAPDLAADLLTARAEIAALTGELARETAAWGEAEGRLRAMHALLDEATALIDDFQSAGHGDGHDSADLIAIKDHQERGARWLAPLLTAGGDLRSAEELAALQPARAPGGEEVEHG